MRSTTEARIKIPNSRFPRLVGIRGLRPLGWGGRCTWLRIILRDVHSASTRRRQTSKPSIPIVNKKVNDAVVFFVRFTRRWSGICLRELSACRINLIYILTWTAIKGNYKRNTENEIKWLYSKCTNLLGCMDVWIYGHTYTCRKSIWINRVRLPILLMVSWTRKMNISLSAFAPENLVSWNGFGSPVPRQTAHLRTQAEYGAYLRDSSRVPR